MKRGEAFCIVSQSKAVSAGLKGIIVAVGVRAPRFQLPAVPLVLRVVRIRVYVPLCTGKRC